MAYIHIRRPDLSVHARDLFNDAQEGRGANIVAAVRNDYIDDINQPLTIARESALHVATIQENPMTASTILKAGGNPNLPDAGGETPLIIATRLNMASLSSEMLAQNGNPNQQDQLGNTALHWVARHGDAPQVKAFLAAGGDPRITNQHGENALHWGVLNPDEEVSRLLVAAGANPKATMMDDRTAIDRANDIGKEDLAGWLTTAEPGPAPTTTGVQIRNLQEWRDQTAVKTAPSSRIAYGSK